MNLEELHSRLDSFLSLEEGWDSYGSKKINPECIERAKKIINFLYSEDTSLTDEKPRHYTTCKEYFVFPTSEGGIQIEINDFKLGEFDITLNPDDKELDTCFLFEKDN